MSPVIPHCRVRLTAVMKSVGANSYRFSISWPRIIPDGGKDDPVNEQGLQFYDDLINELVAVGIQPFVVSLPHALMYIADPRPCTSMPASILVCPAAHSQLGPATHIAQAVSGLALPRHPR